MFNYEPETNPIDPILEDFRYRWSPANVMEVG